MRMSQCLMFEINSIDIVMQVSSFMHPRGGITKSIQLGDPDTLLRKQQVKLSRSSVKV